LGILRNLNRHLRSGGGLIAFALSASQTTLLSFYVAHNVDASSLAVFGFLISVYYFSLLLLRRNIIEPYFQFQEISRVAQEKLQIALIFLFIIAMFSFSLVVNGISKIAFSLFIFSAVSIVWEMRKAELRLSNKIHIYTSLEFLTVVVLFLVISANILGLTIPNELVILGQVVLQVSFLFITRNLTNNKPSQPYSSGIQNKISTSSHGEFIYIGAVLSFNAYLFFRGYSAELGEIRSTFLFLLVSTFSVSALRNSLSVELKWSSINVVLVIIIFCNVLVVLLIPANILQKIIPSFPSDSDLLILLISLDILGSLIFVLTSLEFLKRRNMKSSANARLVSTILLFILFCFFLSDNSSAIRISLYFAVSSMSGALYLLLSMSCSPSKRKFERKI
jgi:hypothetical protein